LKTYNKIKFILWALIVPLIAIELCFHFSQRGILSETNVDIFDQKVKLFRSVDKVDAIFIGSSEVLWGIDPQAFNEAAGGNYTSFNWGLNGMVSSRYLRLLPYLDQYVGLTSKAKHVFIGINFREDSQPLPTKGEDCETMGDLEKPVFFSPFAVDTNLKPNVCKQSLRQQLIAPFEKALAVVRYRSELREILFHGVKIPTLDSLNLTTAGFHYRLPLKDDEKELNLTEEWFKDPKNKAKLSTKVQDLISAEGTYTKLLEYFKNKGVQVTFFVDGTNPRQLKFWDAEENFASDSKVIAEWANSNGASLIDLGILNHFDPLADFADRRHLSSRGAKKFSSQIAEVFSRQKSLASESKSNNGI
jgi:hypothetical protein